MIRFKNISLHLGNKQLLNQFNLTVHKGEKVVFSAPSGSGKTSLIKLVLGFIEPNSGKIIFNQKEATPQNILRIRSQIGYLSQDIDLPNGKVTEVFREIFSAPINKPLHFTDDKLKEKLQKVGLHERILTENTNNISGSERQQLGWALIMLLDRPVLLLDEPTSALNEQMKRFFIDYIIRTNKTVICASHDPEWLIQGIRVIPNFQ